MLYIRKALDINNRIVLALTYTLVTIQLLAAPAALDYPRLPARFRTTRRTPPNPTTAACFHKQAAVALRYYVPLLNAPGAGLSR